MAFDLNTILAAAIKEIVDARVDANFAAHHNAYDHTLLDTPLLRDAVRDAVAEAMKPIDARIAAIEQAVHIDNKSISARFAKLVARIEALEGPQGLGYTAESSLTERIDALEEQLMRLTEVKELSLPVSDRIAVLDDRICGLDARIVAVEGPVSTLELTLGRLVTSTTDDGYVETTQAFDRAIFDAVTARAEDLIEALAEEDCSALMDDGVEAAVTKAIENGEFSIEFNNSGRRRRY